MAIVLRSNSLSHGTAVLGFHSNGTGPMTKPNPTPEVADEVPWSDGITEYDNRHDETYIRLLNADNEGLGKDEMARLILGIDPNSEPERARKAVESHLARARWMTRSATATWPPAATRARNATETTCSNGYLF